MVMLIDGTPFGYLNLLLLMLGVLLHMLGKQITVRQLIE
jgi:hypothetical protein